MDNQDMHPSVLRLLNCAREATAGLSAPIHSIKDMRAALRVTSAAVTNWKSRKSGVPLHIAVQAQELWGCNPSYIREGTLPIWQPGKEPRKSENGEAIYQIVTTQPGRLVANDAGASTAGTAVFTQAISGDTKAFRAPLIEWASIAVSLMRANREWPREATVSFTSVVDRVSDRVKAVTVIESKLPTISAGDRIAIDPEAEPWDDCVIVVQLASGRLELRRFRALADGGWEAILPNEPPLDSVRHGLSRIGVVVALNKMKF